MSSAVIGSLRVNLGLDTAAFSNGLKNAQSGLKRFASMAKVGLMAAAAAAGAMSLAVKGTVNAADDMSKAAQKIGIPIEELSRLKYAADLSDVSFEQLQTSVGKLSRNMAEALEKPTGAAAKAFGNLNIAVANSDGTLRSSSEVMKDIADRFAAMPDGAAKTAAAMELMGRAGAGMIPMLNGGAAALGAAMTEADKFGQVFTAEMGANAEAFNDNLTRLQGAFGMLTAKLATALLPQLKAFTDWLVANAPAITNFVVQTVEGFAAVGRAIGATVQFFTDLDAAIRGFGEAFRATLSQVSTFAHEIVAAFAAIPAQMMAIGGQIIDGLWQGIMSKWESVKSGIASIGNLIPESIRSLLQTHSPSRVMHEVGVDIMEGLRLGMDSVGGAIETTATGTANTVAGVFESLGGALAGFLDKTKSTSEKMKGLFKALLNSIMSMMGSGGGPLGGLFKGILGGLLGFKSGGSFNVGGSGGVDSQLVAFKASPNERVTVTKPGQTAGGGGIAGVRVFVDQDGNWQAKVEGIARGQAASVSAKAMQSVPSMAQKTNDDVQYRRLRPMSPAFGG